MVDKSLGTKRTCPNCEARFYDLNKDPIECPKCHHTFTVEPILPSRQDQEIKPEEAAPATPEPAEEVADDVVEDDAELAAEDVDEAAEVAEVAIEDVNVTVDPDENAFLEDDDAPVEEIIPAAIEKDDEES